MNNTTTAPVSIVITECAVHGTRAASDEATARMCVEVAREDRFDALALPTTHAVGYHFDGTDCWNCCEEMVIDPLGIFDH